MRSTTRTPPGSPKRPCSARSTAREPLRCRKWPISPQGSQAHIHFILSAEGYRPLVTQIFAAGDAYLGSDAVFGVRDSLVVEFIKNESRGDAARYGFKAPFYTVDYDFVLKPAG
ncbi:MAG TPA: hypothetical protein VGJ97_09895 [Anaerolineaceae bacterium]